MGQFTVKLLAVLATCALLFTGYAGYIGVPRAYLYYTGEQVTADVDRCEEELYYRPNRLDSKRVRYHCYGRWHTADGTAHIGRIDGAGPSDEGNSLKVRVRGDSAQVDGLEFLQPAAFFGVAVLVTVMGGLALLVWRRLRRARS
ncbi:MAG: hypothetical protein ACRDT4_24385 [Micromonosporaceae bacterium]